MVRELLHVVTSEAFPGSVPFPLSLASEDVDIFRSLSNSYVWESVALIDCVAIVHSKNQIVVFSNSLFTVVVDLQPSCCKSLPALILRVLASFSNDVMMETTRSIVGPTYSMTRP